MPRLTILAVIAVLTLGACSSSAGTGTASSDNGGAATETPTDTPAATPAPSVVTFSPITLTGTGSKVPKFTIPEGAAAIAAITETGADNFAVTSLDSKGAMIDLLVNVIGNYTGTVLFDVQNDQHSVAFKVESSGSWTITIKPVTSARVWNGTSKLTGKGDDVVRVSPASSGLVSLNITHSGSENFAVTGYSDAGPDLMVNEIGKYSGQVPLADGSFLVSVQADGAWTVTPAS